MRESHISQASADFFPIRPHSQNFPDFQQRERSVAVSPEGAIATGETIFSTKVQSEQNTNASFLEFRLSKCCQAQLRLSSFFDLDYF